MGFRNFSQNVKYFFKWMAELFRTWFAPFHFDEDELLEGEDADTPDGSSDTSVPPVEDTETTDGAVSYGEQYGEDYGSPDLSEILAFRGATTQTALAAILDKNSDDLMLEIESLLDYSMVEDVGDGRYLLLESERRRILRADPKVADWLSRLQHTELEESVLEIIEQLCRQLPLKIMAGKGLVFHVRQRKWMVWQSREDACRVKMFGTLSDEERSHVREIDNRARQHRNRRSRPGWNPNDAVSFQWSVGADALAIESVMLEAGREFQKNVRRRRKNRRRRQPGKSASEVRSG